jgi:YebC/PmpR family DNA-binding regulatory protein
MAGHSHWARIKRAKASTDARRGKAWSKLSRAIIVAARIGGGDPDMNLSLRYAIDAAKAENMPKDTIERAIKKGSGDQDGASFEELVFEGYGPGGAAIVCIALTDNRNRTAPEVKRVFERRGGNLGAPNSVAWMFCKRGVLVVDKDQADEEQLTEIALEHGADDVKDEGEAFVLDCDPSVFESLRDALREAQIATSSAELAMVPSSQVAVTGADAVKTMALIEALEDHDDVQTVYGNYEFSDEDLDKLA